ncbi:MAG: RNA ligase family protein [Myxococcales bacterium]
MRARELDLRKLNSMTKYPSIETLHVIEKGRLQERSNGDAPVGQRLIATEKVDGTNTRILCLPDGSYFIGSREELLHFRGDLVFNPALGIVEAVRDVAEEISAWCEPDRVVVWFGETFGGSIQSAKEYSAEKRTGFRLFDVMVLSAELVATRLAMDLESISRWRDGGGQTFVSDEELGARAAQRHLLRTPLLWEGESTALPHTLPAMLEFLRAKAPSTRCRLDTGSGSAEGLVVRTADRRWIRKARFEDYERTLKNR